MRSTDDAGDLSDWAQRTKAIKLRCSIQWLLSVAGLYLFKETYLYKPRHMSYVSAGHLEGHLSGEVSEKLGVLEIHGERF